MRLHSSFDLCQKFFGLKSGPVIYLILANHSLILIRLPVGQDSTAQCSCSELNLPTGSSIHSRFGCLLIQSVKRRSSSCRATRLLHLALTLKKTLSGQWRTSVGWFLNLALSVLHCRHSPFGLSKMAE